MEAEIKAIKILATNTTLEETVYGEKVNEVEYKLLKSAVFACDLTYGATVLTKRSQNDELVFDGIKELSPFKTRKYLLSGNLTQEAANSLGKDIIEKGGYWEVLMKGFLLLMYQKTCNTTLMLCLKNKVTKQL